MFLGISPPLVWICLHLGDPPVPLFASILDRPLKYLVLQLKCNLIGHNAEPWVVELNFFGQFFITWFGITDVFEYKFAFFDYVNAGK